MNKANQTLCQINRVRLRDKGLETQRARGLPRTSRYETLRARGICGLHLGPAVLETTFFLQTAFVKPLKWIKGRTVACKVKIKDSCASACVRAREMRVTTRPQKQTHGFLGKTSHQPLIKIAANLHTFVTNTNPTQG